MCVYVGISLESRMTSYYAQNSLCTLLIFFFSTVTLSLCSQNFLASHAIKNRSTVFTLPNTACTTKALQLSYFSELPKNSFIKKALGRCFGHYWAHTSQSSDLPIPGKPTMEGLSGYLIAFGGDGGVLQMLRLVMTHHYSAKWAVQTSLSIQNKQPTNPQSKNSYFSMLLWQKVVLWPHFFLSCWGLLSPCVRLGRLLVRLWQRHRAWFQPLESWWFALGSCRGNWRVPHHQEPGTESRAGNTVPIHIQEVPPGRAKGDQSCWENQLSLCLSFGDSRCIGIRQPDSERPALLSFTAGSWRPNQYSPLNKKRAVC